ncbi:hypothetical protein BGZ95_002406 [Linnemannia exigua]|uniref:Bulb-type lectin domain-containing protein n=1 Tax=Linnemannia exigua TaxID=604196 RepID=A0AAD4D5K6_9FUNG|nr:hypothetical protein BGZ95_002406 [Linnemannia exigua]
MGHMPIGSDEMRKQEKYERSIFTPTLISQLITTFHPHSTVHLKMKLKLLIAALLLASQAQALGPTLGVSYVYAIFSSVIHDVAELIKNSSWDKGKVVFFTKVGVNGIGGNAGTDGPFPLMTAWSISKTRVATNDPKIAGLPGHKLPWVDSGVLRPFEISVIDPTDHYEFITTASDQEEANAICVSSISVAPDGNSPSTAYTIPADLVLSMDGSVPWTYSGDSAYIQLPSNGCKSVRIPTKCIWMSNFIKADDFIPVTSISLIDVPNYLARIKEPTPRLPKPENFKIIRATQPLPKRRKRDLDLDRQDYVVSGYQSAKFLCESKSSYGANFLSTTEELFCHMDNNYKDLYPKCSSLSDIGCYRLTNGTLTLVAPTRSNGGEMIISSPLPVMPLSSDDVAPPPSLQKRADCVSGVKKSFLRAGETMSMDDYLAASQGGFQAAVTAKGDFIVYNSDKDEYPLTSATWKLGGDAEEGSYVVEVKKNGQICTRNTETKVLVKCVGVKGPEGPAYVLTLNPEGHLYVNNGDKIHFTTDPSTPVAPDDINGYKLTPINSFKSGISIQPGTTFKSTDGSTKMEYVKEGYLCIYNKLGYNTWCLDQPAGDRTEVWLALSAQGLLCSSRSTGSYLNSRCTGDGNKDSGYFAVLHNDGFLRVYNNEKELQWTRGGAHFHRERNTLRADTFREQRGEVRSDNDKYSIFSHENGGTYILNNSNGLVDWYIGGGYATGAPFIMVLQKDGNLCTRRKSDQVNVNCITDKSRPNDKYLLHMNNDGHAYIYTPNGSYLWRS